MEEAKIVKPNKVVAEETVEMLPMVLGRIVPVVPCKLMEGELSGVPTVIAEKMPTLASWNYYSQISSVLYSYLGHRCLSGDVEALKFLYSNAWEEKPALIRTICELQLRLASVDIDKDTSGIYTTEFLYYWGMICLGEVSRLIPKDLITAADCFKRIETAIPKVESRLAYIELLITDEPNKSKDNTKKLEKLRRWAQKEDLFSRIVLSKIIFSQFLKEKQEDDPNPPILSVRLLDIPCQKGHPVALKFFKEAGDYLASTGVSSTSDMRIRPGFSINPDPTDKRIAGLHVNPDSLLDF